ncbi:MAG: PEP-CTERM sorting domain-containing protein [Bryobacteraceae bacterium]|nr:PEP-CTERM sorting domain-containing protein [Bryobacteraceae bacterium]
MIGVVLRVLFFGFLPAAVSMAITIPLGNSSAAGVHSFSTGIANTSLTPLPAGPTEDSWKFYVGHNPLPAYVVRNDRPPLTGSPALWAPNDSFSRWISPTKQDYKGKTKNCCNLPVSTLTSYTAALTFNVPPMTNPPAWSQWLLVMHGLVWADDRVTGFALFPGATPFGTPVYSFTYSSPFPNRLTPQPFSINTWVNPAQQYTLAFYVMNNACTVTGFRLRMTEAYVTPEPGAWALMLSAAAGLAFVSWRRRRSSRSQS